MRRNPTETPTVDSSPGRVSRARAETEHIESCGRHDVWLQRQARDDDRPVESKCIEIASRQAKGVAAPVAAAYRGASDTRALDWTFPRDIERIDIQDIGPQRVQHTDRR